MKLRLIISILTITSSCLAQSLQVPANVQAPTTASLGKYGDVPVSLYNGTTNVSIPIVTITEKGMSLDISLSYDASGVRVDAAPGWVGQNWSLNAGGVITRQINGGYPDEFKIETSVLGESRYGYMYPIAHDRLNVANWNDPTVLFNIENSNHGLGTNTMNADGKGKDSEPDVFTFNFMGHSGKFFMGEDGQWKVASSENFKVIISESDFTFPFNLANDSYGNPFSKAIGKIVLKDDQGNTYTFGDNPSSNASNTSIEYSKDFFRQSNIGGSPDTWKASSWYLTKVQNSTGIVLFTFNYVRENGYTGFFYNNQWATSSTTALSGGVLVTNCSSSIGSGFSGSGSPEVGGSLISPVYLTQIIPYSNESVNFNSTNTLSTFYESTAIKDVSNYISNLWSNTMPDVSDQSGFFKDLIPYLGSSQIINKLKYRKLTDISGFACSVSFNFNEPSYSGQLDNRFNLNNVTINGDLYQFEYDRFEQLPRLMSKAVDHLGYYNGTEYPNVINSGSHFNQRLTNSDKVLVGSLIKIIYPTKGYTQFEYEPHQYSQYVSDDKQSLISVANSIIGGIRIKKITNNDLNNNSTVKEYKYVKNYNLNHASTVSSGILNNLPKYLWLDWRIQSAPGSPSGYLSEDHFSVNPLISMSNFFGSPIGYSEVVEVRGDQSYTINKYTSNENYKDEPFVTTFNLSPSPYQKYNDKSMLRGKLIESSMYNNADNIVNKTSSIYSTNDPNLIKYVRGASLKSKACSGNAYGFLMGNTYKIYYFDNNLINEQNISYLNGQELKTESNYVYQYYPDLNSTFGDYFLKSKITQSYLNYGQINSVNVQEDYDYPFNITSSINTGLVLNRVLVPLQKTTRKNGVVISTDKIEYANFNPYYFTFPQKILHSKGANPLEENIIIDAYDSSGNIIMYHTKDGIYTTMSWCYNKKYPIIKIVGDQIFDTSFIDTKSSEIQNLINTSAPPQSFIISPIIAKLNEVRSNFPYHQVTTYTYYPGYGKVTSITDPRGNTTYYNYDFGNFGRLLNVKDNDGNILSENEYHYKN